MVYISGDQLSEAVTRETEPPRVRLNFACDQSLADRVGEVARENSVDQAEALRQLVEIGLDQVSSDVSD
jgi:hypothetical protein